MTGGAIGGGIWGTLIGLLFLNPLVGAAVGAGAGALAGKFSDIGIDDEFLRDVGHSLDKGGAAVGVLVRKMTPDKVLEGLERLPRKGPGHPDLAEPRRHEAKLRDVPGARAAAALPADQLGGGTDSGPRAALDRGFPRGV